MKNHKDLREFIVEKFGNLRKFLDAAGLPYETTRKFMHRSYKPISEDEQKKITAMFHLAENINPSTDRYKLTEEEIKAIRVCIWNVYGGTKPMSLLNREWGESAVSNLVNGRLERKSYRVYELMLLLVDKANPNASDDVEKAINILKESILMQDFFGITNEAINTLKQSIK